MQYIGLQNSNLFNAHQNDGIPQRKDMTKSSLFQRSTYPYFGGEMLLKSDKKNIFDCHKNIFFFGAILIRVRQNIGRFIFCSI